MKNKRYFVLQSGTNLYTVTSVDVHKRKKEVTVTLDKVDTLHLAFFKNPELRKGNPAAKPQINVFMKDSTTYTMDEPHTIPVERIARIEMLD